MKERPILFSADMVRAILDGTKTQTRRIVKGQWPWLQDPEKFYSQTTEERDHLAEPAVIKGEEWNRDGIFYWYESEYPEEGGIEFKCPYGKPGDRLWVRETWQRFNGVDDNDAFYKADCQDNKLGNYPFTASRK